ncbi:hypothetical protein LJR220_004871 [Bradyrhizobium sp. LjRoot220]|uniref:hypothetical protein n=1 Tax=Bradyrhizobium sp. LjRoot220 TaxID=3342284 RepID=UPI003ED16A1D
MPESHAVFRIKSELKIILSFEFGCFPGWEWIGTLTMASMAAASRSRGFLCMGLFSRFCVQGDLLPKGPLIASSPEASSEGPID